jgi:hypothetical protein
MRVLFITLAAGAALVAGCSPKPADNGANAAAGNVAAAAPAAPATTPAAAPAAAAAAAGPITLADLPAPTAGQWRRVSSQDGAAADTSTKCLSGKVIDPTEGAPPCAKITAVRTATGGFVVDGDCPNNGVSAKLHMAGEGDFKTSFTTDAQMSMTGGPGPPVSMKNHSVWTYVGPCPKS